MRSPARDPFGSSARKGPQIMIRRQVLALMFRNSRGAQTTSLRASVNAHSIWCGGEETYGVARIGRASNSDSTQQKGVFTMGQGIGTGEPTLIDSIYDNEAAPTAEQVADVVAKVAGAGAGNTLEGRRI